MKGNLAFKPIRYPIFYPQRNDDWNLSVYNRNGQRLLDIEVKAKLNTSPDWAAQFRRNILAHGTFYKAPYFLMVFLDRFYLWTDADAQSDQSQPTYSVDARPILQSYLEGAGITAERISRQSLELIIESWLWQMINSEKSAAELDKSQQWLVDSGLYEAITGGKFDYEVVV
jgi:hypothetical protein